VRGGNAEPARSARSARSEESRENEGGNVCEKQLETLVSENATLSSVQTDENIRDWKEQSNEAKFMFSGLSLKKIS